MLLIGIMAFEVRAQDKSLFKYEQFVAHEDTLLYRMLYPKDFDANKKYPLLLFLHGAGERGQNNERQLAHGSKLFLEEKNREEYPAIIVFPQCPKEDYWSNVAIKRNEKGKRSFDFSPEGDPTDAMQKVIHLMDSLSSMSTVDQSRVYVMGLSMGGMGTFEIVKRKPELFAAAVPICGGGDPDDVGVYAEKVSFWVFHGGKDDIVLPEHSIKMVEAMKNAGAEVKFTLFPDANHNSWDPAFAEPDLLPWLFSKSK